MHYVALRYEAVAKPVTESGFHEACMSITVCTRAITLRDMIYIY
jgi:hypothetical protein